MRVAYICHPFRGDVAANRDQVRLICETVKHDYVPLAPHLLLPSYIEEATDRNLALDHGLALLRCTNELWICSDRITEGMRGELAEAKRLGLPVWWFRLRPGGYNLEQAPQVLLEV